MNFNWDNKKIGDIVDIRRGASPRPIHNFLSTKGMPWVKIADATSDPSRYIWGTNEYIINEGVSKSVKVDPETLIVSNSATPGLPKIMKIEACVHDGWLVFSNYRGVTRDFLYYKFIDIRRMLVNQANGSVFQNLKTDIVRDFNIKIPSIDVQNRIVNILSKLDEKIELNSAINNNLEQQAQAIFDNMFPNISNGSCAIGDYITPKRGKSLLSKNAIFGDVPVIAGGLEPSTYHNVANTQSPVLAISASGANAGYVSLWNIPIWSSDSSYIDSSMTDDVYFWYVLLKKRQKEIFDAQTGSAQPHIYPQHIASMSVSNLDIEKVHSYTSIVTPIFEIIGHHKEENTRLASLRDTLLPKLMSGELDVSDIDL